MAKYIECEKAIELLSEPITMSMCLSMDECHHKIAQRRIDLYLIENIPAADVRPVVFCKDCKWYQIDELKKDGTEDRRYKPSVCVLAEQRREPNHFCADGEKREES